MAGQLFTSTDLDADGRQPLLSDAVLGVHYYSTAGETWDKSGSAGQSWYQEVYLPNDLFDTSQVLSDRWAAVNSTVDSGGNAWLESGLLKAEIVKDEGWAGLSSGGKWSLSGDFDIRLYIDWDSYYNEYRSIAHTFLKVGHDGANAARITFSFDGVDTYAFNSEKTVGRSLTYFDWQDNGDLLEPGSFSACQEYTYLKIVRSAGVITTYVFDGTEDVQVGEALSDAVFSGDLFVELGVETKEYNTYRSAFTKFYAFEATLAQGTEFFSPVRGRKQAFPERVVIAADAQAISIIDEAESKLWLRLALGDESPVPLGSTSVYGCNGYIYCATADGLVVFDFHRDKIYKYKGKALSVADEPIALRNSNVTFRELYADIGTLPSDNLYAVASRVVDGQDYIAVTHDAGVSVMRTLASGVASCPDGPTPGSRVSISEGNNLYWAGYDPTTDEGDLSYYSGVNSLACSGTTSFSRAGYYNPDTPHSIFTPHITCFDVTTVGSEECIAVGTAEGISFLSVSPGASYIGAFSYGPDETATNPVSDPSFENYLGVDWQVGYNGLLQKFFATREDTFSAAGEYCLRMRFTTLGIHPETQEYAEGVAGWVYQDVDFTGLSSLYFDLKIVTPTSGAGSGDNVWNFEVLVGGTVVKSYRDVDGPFIKYTDSADVSAFTGVQQLYFRLRIVADTTTLFIGERMAYVDNIRAVTDEPDYRVLPEGNAAIQEVLLQYDYEGHKVYFSTAGGYGAVDLDLHSLDYFMPVDTYVPGAETGSADFARIEEDAS